MTDAKKKSAAPPKQRLPSTNTAPNVMTNSSN